MHDDRKKIKEAEASFKRALELRKEAGEEDGYLVGQSLINLAAFYEFHKRNLDEIEPLYLEALNIWEGQLDSNHPEMALGWSNLAGFYDRKKKFGKALKLYEKLLVNCEHRLGENHSETVFYRRKLSECIKKQKKRSFIANSSKNKRKPSKGFG